MQGRFEVACKHVGDLFTVAAIKLQGSLAIEEELPRPRTVIERPHRLERCRQLTSHAFGNAQHAWPEGLFTGNQINIRCNSRCRQKIRNSKYNSLFITARPLIRVACLQIFLLYQSCKVILAYFSIYQYIHIYFSLSYM